MSAREQYEQFMVSRGPTKTVTITLNFIEKPMGYHLEWTSSEDLPLETITSLLQKAYETVRLVKSGTVLLLESQ